MKTCPPLLNLHIFSEDLSPLPSPLLCRQVLLPFAIIIIFYANVQGNQVISLDAWHLFIFHNDYND